MPSLTHTTTLITTTCWCGVPLAIPQSLYNEANDSGKAIYCPASGHTFVFGDTYKERLAKEQERLAAERRRVEATRELLRAEERSHATTRGHLTRTKKRVGHGVCPCCNRTFQQLQRHMKTKHPEYVATNDSA